jgi:hypothetical protein
VGMEAENNNNNSYDKSISKELFAKYFSPE